MRLPGEFVSSQMISLTMGDSSGAVGMRCKVVKFRESVMGTLWHRVFLIVARHWSAQL